ncbi:MAG: methyl-accepting chemotaxis protein [Desulfobacteraceae bacterium]|nr:methyl-accepting chemotaxis protein [Desulfobacteraceae bacterium]MBL7174175.1 methyl-accepting chemotaxis protein [Desulfobacteraceae bacterium]
MNRTSIKNKLILSFLALLLIVIVVVGVTNRITNDFLTALAISAALALAAGIIFGGIFSRSIVTRLNNLSTIAREISHGDLSKEIPILSRDEIRDLEEVFAKMVNDLRDIISEIKRVSSQIDETGGNLSNLIDKVLTNSQEIDNSALAIAKGSEKQTLIVQKTSVIIDKGLEQMDDAARQSAQTVSKAKDALAKTETGEANARETMGYLEDVLKQMADNAEPIYRLSNKVEKIKMVMSVLDEVSQKTDLLSLNASIEATRAGEMGKGFALVANEIRTMAENSRHSSQEIRRIVDDIFEDNKAAIEALRKSEGYINKGRGIIHGIVGTFGEMLSGVKEISGDVKEVENLTRKQVKEMRGLLNQVQELSRLAQENFVSAQKTTIGTKNQKEEIKEIVNAMKSLNALSEKMMETQRRFRLRGA